MDRTIDGRLSELKSDIKQMGSCVEQALKICSEGLLQQDPQFFSKVHEIEDQINDLQIKIDKTCTTILAQQGPVAKDLRYVLSILRMNVDLERMGDQCTNISYLAKDIIHRKDNVSFNELSAMSVVVCDMIRRALDCFIKLDAQAARDVLKMDDEVDRFKMDIRSESINHLKKNVDLAESYLDVILISRSLERLGDHATNIAEEVIFALSGEDVRHSVS